jgi:hypothetical protein
VRFAEIWSPRRATGPSVHPHIDEPQKPSYYSKREATWNDELASILVGTKNRCLGWIGV